mmetsp:Transcript_109990/g.267434  ORF Transcript_109990/g.267434 Transcript_109990/m.267434 type:complete len:811 (+) Transcript_109990:113-2545(+)
MASKSARKPKDRSESKSAHKGKSGNKATQEAVKDREESWNLRLYDTRKWGQRLNKNGGSDPVMVKKLLKTLQDPRVSLEGPLRRTAIEALTPAAAVGHRGALAAQTAALKDSSDVVRRCALECLGAAAGARRAEAGGAVAVALTEALPRSFSSLDSVEVRRARASALLHLAPRGDKELVSIASAWLKDDDAEVRMASVRALGAIGESQAVVSNAEECLADPDWRVRQAAVRSLEKLATCLGHPVRKSIASDVLSAQGSSSAPLQERTASKARTKTPPAKSPSKSPSRTPSKAAAKGAAKSPSKRPSSRGQTPEVRQEAPTNALEVLPKLTKAEERRFKAETAALGTLARCCSTGSLIGLQRQEALVALSRCAPPDDPAVLQAAGARLADCDADVRHEATRILSSLEDREGATQAASAYLSHPDFRVRASARRAVLQSIEAAPETTGVALSHAVAALESSDWAGRRGAAQTLRQLGEGSSSGQGLNSALQSLLPRLRHTDWSIRRKAAQAVAEVAGALGGSEEAVDLLAIVLADADEDVRLAAATALPLAAPTKSQRAVSLTAELATGDPIVAVRLRALESMGALAAVDRSRSRIAVHAVVQCLEDEDGEVHALAEHVLRAIARDRRTTVDDLALRLVHDDERVRLTAARLFEIVRSRRERVNRRVVKLFEHPNEGVRAAARTAMSAFADPHEGQAIAVAARILATFRHRASLTPPPEVTPSPKEATVSPASSKKGKRGKAKAKPPISSSVTRDHADDGASSKAASEAESQLEEEETQVPAELSDSDTDIEGLRPVTPINTLAAVLGMPSH